MDYSGFITCFEETFGFQPPDSEDFKKEEEKPKLPLYKYVEYPENFYIPKNRFELSCANISIWKKTRYTPYKRISHFREHLNRLQGCQYINIPENVIETVRQKISNEQIKSNNNLYYIIKDLLRENHQSHFNEHIHHLISLVLKEYMYISYNDHRSLCKIFQEIETLFIQQRRDSKIFFTKRKNLISYYLIVQLLLYLFHYHPRYKLPTLYDVFKRREYYLILLGLIQQCSFGPPLLEEHFRRKKDCKFCQMNESKLVFDNELLELI